MKSSRVTIDGVEYDMNDYLFILLAKTTTIGSYPDRVYFLKFINDKNCNVHSKENIFIAIDKMNDKDVIYGVVDDYLKDHPNKRVGFDGCCYYYL